MYAYVRVIVHSSAFFLMTHTTHNIPLNELNDTTSIDSLSLFSSFDFNPILSSSLALALSLCHFLIFVFMFSFAMRLCFLYSLFSFSLHSFFCCCCCCSCWPFSFLGNIFISHSMHGVIPIFRKNAKLHSSSMFANNYYCTT